MNRTVFALVALAVAPGALAKKPAPEPPPPPPTMAAEAPEQVKALQPMLGKWLGTGNLVYGGQTYPFTGTWDCTVGSGGYAVRCQLEGNVEGLGAQLESDLIGWNANDGLYHWFSVVNTGEVHDHYGSFDGNVMTFQQQGAQNGHLTTERVTITIDGASMAFDAKVMLGNAVDSTFTGTLTRQ